MNKEDFSGLIYDPLSGMICRAKTPSKPITTTNKSGYVVVKANGKLWYAHRIAWFLHTGQVPQLIDHINGDKADNRIANLRAADDLINNHNRLGATKSNKSCGLLGVTKPRQTRKWAAHITVHRKRKHLGYFDTAEEAHAAYLVAKQIHHPSAPVN